MRAALRPLGDWHLRRFMDAISGHGFGPLARYGLPVAAVALATLLRFLAPLDVAPFLLYLPLVFLVTLAGAALESWIGTGLGLVTLVVLTVASAAATSVVRRRDLLTTVVAPPLVDILVAALNTALAPSASLNLASVATLLIRGFPAMAIATAAAAVVALIRWAARR